MCTKYFHTCAGGQAVNMGPKKRLSYGGEQEQDAQIWRKFDNIDNSSNNGQNKLVTIHPQNLIGAKFRCSELCWRIHERLYRGMWAEQIEYVYGNVELGRSTKEHFHWLLRFKKPMKHKEVKEVLGLNKLGMHLKNIPDKDIEKVKDYIRKVFLI